MLVAIDKAGNGVSFRRSNRPGVTLRHVRKRDRARSRIYRSACAAHDREPRLVRVVRTVAMPGGAINVNVFERRP